MSNQHIPRPIRVLHVIKALGRGGAEVLLREGYGAADPTRVHLEFATLRDRPDDLLHDLRSTGAPVHELGFRTDAGLLLAAWKLVPLLRARRIDIIHAHLPLAGFVARLAGRLAGLPVVYTEHNMPDRYRMISRLANQLSWHWQHHVIAISRDVRASIHACYGSAVPVATVFNGVNTERFAPASTAIWASPSPDLRADSLVIGTVAVFSNTPQKRLDLWIEVVSKVMARNSSVHALLVGYGSLRDKLERQAAATGFGDRFHFVGQQSDVRPFLARMDIFLMSSSYEGFGIAPVEAMSMCVPVVATAVSGVREVVHKDRTGILVPFDEKVVDGLDEALMTLLEDAELRTALGLEARRHVQESLSIKRMQRSLEDIYSAVVGSEPMPYAS